MVTSTRPASPSSRPLPPAAPAPALAPVPARLWLLRNKRTGQFVQSSQESRTIAGSIYVTVASPEALAEAVEFYERFCLQQVEPVPVI